MAQFDVFRNPNASVSGYPLLLDVQSDLLAHFKRRVVVPLAPLDGIRGPVQKQLTPTLEINHKPMVMVTPLLAAIDTTSFGKAVASVGSYRTEIIAALDMLFTGA